MDKIDDYSKLLEGYEHGLYTDGEVVSAALGLLFESTRRELFWKSLTPAHCEKMERLLHDFDETAEPFTIRGDPHQVWYELSTLKRWLEEVRT
jgi:hypothetical protein